MGVHSQLDESARTQMRSGRPLGRAETSANQPEGGSSGRGQRSPPILSAVSVSTRLVRCW